ncbi:MAG: protein-L-isoaspartate O-methyltransferase family protein [Steroidobacteraceae bacterium]
MLTADVREQMIEQQVRAWDVLDGRVLQIFRKVPREQFTPEQQRFRAYADAEVPLAHGQHMLRPSVAGRLLQALQLTGSEHVLEIGAGSGFITACLRTVAARVRSLEIFPGLALMARRNLDSLGMRDVDVVTADGLQLDTATRYDAIAITASLPVYDERFARQLAIGGRLFMVVGEPPVMEGRLIRRTGEGSWASESLFETVIDPLVNAQRLPEFRF